ncbi:hypothetical protein C8Q78DRAFT_781929 [Trametes maxima]|nr:hypothetical protein C8Q78DRAFT_781929 [Trametes maxima]
MNLSESALLRIAEGGAILTNQDEPSKIFGQCSAARLRRGTRSMRPCTPHDTTSSFDESAWPVSSFLYYTCDVTLSTRRGVAICQRLEGRQSYLCSVSIDPMDRQDWVRYCLTWPLLGSNHRRLLPGSLSSPALRLFRPRNRDAAVGYEPDWSKSPIFDVVLQGILPPAALSNLPRESMALQIATMASARRRAMHEPRHGTDVERTLRC